MLRVFSLKVRHYKIKTITNLISYISLTSHANFSVSCFKWTSLHHIAWGLYCNWVSDVALFSVSETGIAHHCTSDFIVSFVSSRFYL